MLMSSRDRWGRHIAPMMGEEADRWNAWSVLMPMHCEAM